MAEIKNLPTRSEVPIELTWNLEQVYSNLDQWHADEQKVLNQIDELAAYKGKLASSATELLQATQLYLAIYRKYEKLAVFASMKNDQDTTNAKFQQLQSDADN